MTVLKLKLAAIQTLSPSVCTLPLCTDTLTTQLTKELFREEAITKSMVGVIKKKKKLSVYLSKAMYTDALLTHFITGLFS